MPLPILELIKTIFPYLLGSGGLILFLLSRKQRNANAEVTEASALQGMQKSYQQYVKDNNEVIAELRKEIKEIRGQLKRYINQCKDCSNNKM
ncbi:hypothetical protein [Flavobacterium sp.]|uniref:hypothetical protein n=1 Tax=Flavobacterium sp. TaxID=239 RepID=UPI00391D53CA